MTELSPMANRRERAAKCELHTAGGVRGCGPVNDLVCSHSALCSLLSALGSLLSPLVSFLSLALISFSSGAHSWSKARQLRAVPPAHRPGGCPVIQGTGNAALAIARSSGLHSGPVVAVVLGALVGQFGCS